MKIKKRYIIIPLTILLVISSMSYGLFQLMKMRIFQLFGELVYRVETNQKVVALTFDDAPTPEVESVLQTLVQKQVKATFYEIGSSIEHYPDIAKAIVQAGMEPGNHFTPFPYSPFAL